VADRKVAKCQYIKSFIMKDKFPMKIFDRIIIYVIEY